MDNLFKKLKKRSKILINTNITRLGGINQNGYPRHLFKKGCSSEHTFPLCAIFVGKDYWKKGCFRFRENSNTCALEFVLSGEFEIEQNSHFYKAKPGSLFLVHKNVNSIMYCNVANAKKYTIILSGRMLQSTLNELELAHLDILPKAPEGTFELFEEIEHLVTKAEENYEMEVSCLIYRLLLLLASSAKSNLPELLQKVIHFIETNLEKSLSIEELSAEFNISFSTLHRLFKEHLNTTPNNFIVKAKMSAASNLLIHTEQSIKEIAISLGFSSQLYFATVFRKTHGISPTQYRRSAYFFTAL